MDIIGGLDIHRRQITFDYLEVTTGEARRGKILSATRAELGDWLSRFEGLQISFALEATTGWRFVVEELQAVGATVYLAEPADTRALRGTKRRAKTDGADARHLRDLVIQERIPQSWIPPAHILELRTRIRLYKALQDERRVWQQRIQAQLFHQGVPPIPDLSTTDGRHRLDGALLSTAARQVVEVALEMIEHLDRQLHLLYGELAHFARSQPGCRALMGHFGIGPIVSVAILAELGDARRFSSARLVVRHSGLDITVYESDGKRAPGKLLRQGPSLLRWALFEAAQAASRKNSPDHSYYLQLKARLNHNQACLSVARKILRRAYHSLKELGDQALAEAA